MRLICLTYAIVCGRTYTNLSHNSPLLLVAMTVSGALSVVNSDTWILLQTNWARSCRWAWGLDRGQPGKWLILVWSGLSKFKKSYKECCQLKKVELLVTLPSWHV